MINWTGWENRRANIFQRSGFRTKNGLCVGLLTDSGYRNQWTRIIRRDGRPVKPAPARIPDANLYSAARREQRDQGEFFIQQTFGELLEQLPGDVNGEAITLPDISSWKKHGDVALEAVGGVVGVVHKEFREWRPCSVYGGQPGALLAERAVSFAGAGSD